MKPVPVVTNIELHYKSTLSVNKSFYFIGNAHREPYENEMVRGDPGNRLEVGLLETKHGTKSSHHASLECCHRNGKK